MNTGKQDNTDAMLFEVTLTIGRPPKDLYPFWRNMENLPLIMEHLESVRMIDRDTFYWVARGPAGKKVEWKTRINGETPGKLLSWEAVEGSDILTAASVAFRKAPGDRGTEVKLKFRYDPPGGALGALIVKLIGEDPGKEIREGLRRFKQLMETGEILTTECQPSGRQEDRKCAQGIAA